MINQEDIHIAFISSFFKVYLLKKMHMVVASQPFNVFHLIFVYINTETELDQECYTKPLWKGFLQQQRTVRVAVNSLKQVSRKLNLRGQNFVEARI